MQIKLKTAIIAGVIIAVVSFSGALIYSQTAKRSEQPIKKLDVKTFSEALSREDNIKCTFSGVLTSSDYSGTINGTLYLSSDNSKLEIFLRPQNGETTSLNYLTNSNFGYMWTGVKGMKLSLEEKDRTAFYTKNVSSDLLSAVNQSSDFSCYQETPDSTLFQVPENVAFNDFLKPFNMIFDKMKEEFSKYCQQCYGSPTEEAVQRCLEYRSCDKL